MLPVCYVARADGGRVVVLDSGCVVPAPRARSFAAALLDCVCERCGFSSPTLSGVCSVAVFDSVSAPFFRTADRTRAEPPLARYVASVPLSGVPVPRLECPNIAEGVGAAVLLRSMFPAAEKKEHKQPPAVLFTSVVEPRAVEVESVAALVECLQWWLRSVGATPVAPERLCAKSLAAALATLPWNKPSELFA